MSKIGRKPILISSAEITINENVVIIKGPKTTLTHEIPEQLKLEHEGNQLLLTVKESDRKSKMLWGLHRALLANKVCGAEKGFVGNIKIVGLGYKALLTGRTLVFSLGYSHKKEYTLPEGIEVDIDKSGQNLVFKGSDKFVLGNVCDAVRSLRPPEPYKGTGILRNNEFIIRKAGKTKS